MAVKYHCKKCGKRFVEWGAQKLGFKCPDCTDEELVRVGMADDKALRKPSLKRRPRRAAALGTVDEEGLGVDIDEMEMEENEEEEVVFIAPDDESEPVGFDLDGGIPEAIVGSDDTELDLSDDFGDVAPPLTDDALDEPLDETEPWHE